jgi:hypothetical protein
MTLAATVNWSRGVGGGICGRRPTEEAICTDQDMEDREENMQEENMQE